MFKIPGNQSKQIFEKEQRYLGCTAVIGVLSSVGWVSWKILLKNRKSGPLYVSVTRNPSNPEARGWLDDLSGLQMR